MSALRPEVQAKGHGVYMIQEVIELLETAGHICCVTGVKALRYYGAGRVSSDWHICVPNSEFPAATQLIDNRPEKFEKVDSPMPQPSSLIHTYPRYRSTQEDCKTLGFYIMPSSEDFLEDLDENAIERSPNNIPYPKLELFAQNLVSIQKWMNLTDLVDGMDLSLEWGQQNLRLGTLSEEEVEHVGVKVERYIESTAGLGRHYAQCPGGLRIDGVDKTRKWERIVSLKRQRADSHFPYGSANWSTQFKRKDSGDPRLRRDRPV